MRINTKVRYAIRMMADIAGRSRGQPVALRDVAERQALPRLYLPQLTAPLKNAGLLRSVWGNKGGYVLGRPAQEIKLLDIMEAVDGPVGIIECVLDPGSCDRSDYCGCLGVWRDINSAIVRILENYTLADLAGESRLVTRTGDTCAVLGTASEEVSTGSRNCRRTTRSAPKKVTRVFQSHKPALPT